MLLEFSEHFPAKRRKGRPRASGDSPNSSALVLRSSGDFRELCNDNIMVPADLQSLMDSKFTPKKSRSLLLADTYRELGFDCADRVANCGTFLQFHVLGDLYKLTAANFCGDRLCPTCNWRRSLKIFGQVSKMMDFLQANDPDLRYLFLTLTLRNEDIDHLFDMVEALLGGWRFLYHKHTVFRKVVLGTFRVLEVTINHDKHTFHAHLHVVLAVHQDYFHKGYISQAGWAQMWRESCNLDYTPITDIRAIQPKPGTSGLGSAVAEVCKYSVKDSDYLIGDDTWRPRYVEALALALSGRRLIGKTGCFGKAWRALNLSDPERVDNEDLDAADLREDVAATIIRYGWRSGAYVRLNFED